MNSFLHLTNNTSLYIYTQEWELYHLSLPLSRTPRPRLLYRGYKNHLTTLLYQGNPIYLFENVRNQVVLLYTADDDGTLDEILLLAPEETTNIQYQDLRLEIIQGKLFFFYSFYDPTSRLTDFYYCLPFEQLSGTLICRLSPNDILPAADIIPEIPNNTQNNTQSNPKIEQLSVPAEQSDEIKRLEIEIKKAANARIETEKEAANLKAVVEKISAQYNELYEYTVQLQEEAKRLKKLTES